MLLFGKIKLLNIQRENVARVIGATESYGCIGLLLGQVLARSRQFMRKLFTLLRKDYVRKKIVDSYFGEPNIREYIRLVLRVVF